MSHCTHATAWALKKSGFQQPEPAFGQIWYTGQVPTKIIICGPIDFEGDYPHVPDHHTAIYSGEKEDWAFAPTLEYIVPLLPIPELFHFEIWNNTPSCRFRYDENPRRTFGETFAEAAAKMWLELKQNESPGQTFVQPGDA